MVRSIGETASCGVSVIVPAYNYARYLCEAIDSALCQTHEHLEVLVVDDGSTDETPQLVGAYQDPRVRYIHQSNQGLSAARNTGIREARYEFIAFLDADDRWRRTHLADALATFAALPPSVALVASGSDRIDQYGRPIPTRRSPCHDDFRQIPVSDIIIKTRFMPSSAVVRQKAFLECGDFDTTLRSSEDREMWIRIGTKFGVACRTQPTVEVRKHGANMSNHADRMRVSMETVIERARENGVVPRRHLLFWRKVWALHHFQFSWMLHDEGRLKEAVRAATMSLLSWPFPLRSQALGEPTFFRLRALYRFILAMRSTSAP